jgi:hypothetical protein
MHRVAQKFAFAGLGLAAGVAMGVGPAQAATTTGQASARATTTQAQGTWDDGDVVGYYSTLRRCERAGRIGEWRDRWDDYDCYRVRWGLNRGAWALEVDYGHDWDDDDRGWSISRLG